MLAAALMPAASASSADNTPAPASTSIDADGQAGASPLGFRYGGLSTRETRALRRGFKLPLDALVEARSVEDLASSVVVAPLPPTDRPFLAVKAASASDARNPFEDRVATSFRIDPMRALGEMLSASEVDDADAGSAPSDDLLADSALDDLGGAVADSAPDADAEVSDEEEDPFADDASPFGSEDEDPFAF